MYWTKQLNSRPKNLPGFIYLVHAVGTDRFKIGRALNVPIRLRALQTSSPLKIRYVYHACVENMSQSEMELHQKFSHKREIGEWFVLTTEDVKYCILLMRLMIKTEVPQSLELPMEAQEEIKSILQCHANGINNKNRILKEVWGVSTGGGQSYRNAKAQYEFLMPFIREPAGESLKLTHNELGESLLQLQARGYGKAKIILELWGVTKGGSAKYKAAEAEYKRLVGEE
jgi:hypothetical protein